MGLLSLGTPLDWEQAKPFAGHVRSHGLTQFLYTWDRLKDRFGDELLWGDEVLMLTWARSCHNHLLPPVID
jgi:glutamate--cysteine ligase catalytic subunit